MKIGLLSDTHVPDVALKLPQTIARHFHGVDLIMHAGDIFAASVLDDLQNLGPVIAARGDGDSGDILADKRVRWKHVIAVGGKTIWLIHELPYPYPVHQWQRTDVALRDGGRPDVVVFGHDHCTIVEKLGGVLLVNPGSPTFLNYRRGPGTVGILEIDEQHVDVKIVEL